MQNHREIVDEKYGEGGGREAQEHPMIHLYFLSTVKLQHLNTMKSMGSSAFFCGFSPYPLKYYPS